MRAILILLSLLLISCTPYKMDIRQGNYVTPEAREKLKIGMTRAQVRYVLGSPAINDAFHGNRWDYVYRLEHDGKMIETQNMTLFFEGDNLVRIDDGGKTAQAVAAIAPPQPIVPPPVAIPPVVGPPVVVAQPQPAAKIDPVEDILKSVQAWAAAWSARNFRGYLAAYLPDYKPQGMSRDAWVKQRQERISKPMVLEVKISEVSVSVQDAGHASVSFAQHYRSDLYRDSTRKTLQLEKLGDAWLIASEQVVK